jgi:hypothetical protein
MKSLRTIFSLPKLETLHNQIILMNIKLVGIKIFNEPV